MSKPYLYAYDITDQKIPKYLSLDKMDILNKFEQNEDYFKCLEDCTVEVTLRIQFILINPEITENMVEIIAYNSSIEIPGSVTAVNISNNQPINITFVAELHKGSNIYFHIKSDNDNIKIGASSFNESNNNLPKSETPISATLVIKSL